MTSGKESAERGNNIKYVSPPAQGNISVHNQANNGRHLRQTLLQSGREMGVRIDPLLIPDIKRLFIPPEGLALHPTLSSGASRLKS